MEASGGQPSAVEPAPASGLRFAGEPTLADRTAVQDNFDLSQASDYYVVGWAAISPSVSMLPARPTPSEEINVAAAIAIATAPPSGTVIGSIPAPASAPVPASAPKAAPAAPAPEPEARTSNSADSTSTAMDAAAASVKGQEPVLETQSPAVLSAKDEKIAAAQAAVAKAAAKREAMKARNMNKRTDQSSATTTSDTPPLASQDKVATAKAAVAKAAALREAAMTAKLKASEAAHAAAAGGAAPSQTPAEMESMSIKPSNAAEGQSTVTITAHSQEDAALPLGPPSPSDRVAASPADNPPPRKRSVISAVAGMFSKRQTSATPRMASPVAALAAASATEMLGSETAVDVSDPGSSADSIASAAVVAAGTAGAPAVSANAPAGAGAPPASQAQAPAPGFNSAQSNLALESGATAESDEPELLADAFGNPFEFAVAKRRLRHVEVNARKVESPSAYLDPTVAALQVWNDAKVKLKHIYGTAEQLRSMASQLGPRDDETPAFVAVAQAKQGAGPGVHSMRGFPRGAAVAALGTVDADAIEDPGKPDEDLLGRSGRPIGTSMLYIGQLGIVAFGSFLLDVTVLASLWVLPQSDAPLFGVDRPPFPPPMTSPPPPNPLPPPASLPPLSLVEDIEYALTWGWQIPRGLPSAVMHSLDAPSVHYQREYFFAAIAALALHMLVSVAASILSPGFDTLNSKQKRIFLLLAPFNLHVVYMGYLYANSLSLSASRDDFLDAKERFECVQMLKMLQAALENLPLVLITMSTLDMTRFWQVHMGGLVMGTTSIAFGFYAYSVEMFRTRIMRFALGRMQLFLCILVHLSWEVVAMANFVAERRLASWRWSCLPIMVLMGFMQIAPSLKSASHGVGCCGFFVTLIALTPLACLAAIVDGPLLGFASQHSLEHGFQIGSLDRIVAGRRRTLLATFAAIGSLVEFIHLPSNLPPHMFTFQRTTFEIHQLELLFEVPNMSVHLTQKHTFFIRVALMGLLFLADLIASSRSWRLLGFEHGPDLMEMVHKCICRCGYDDEARSRRYQKVAPELEPPLPLEPKPMISQQVRGFNVSRLSEGQQRLHDSLEALYWHMSETSDLLVKNGAKEARTSSIDSERNPLEFAGIFSRRIEIDNVPEVVALEVSSMLQQLLRMTPSECLTAEGVIARFVPSTATDTRQVLVEELTQSQVLLNHLRQVNVPALQRRMQQEALSLRVAANGGLGHHPFRSLSVGVAFSDSAIWQGVASYESSLPATRATHFISHCWADGGGQKASMLRGVLCLQPLLYSVLVIAPIVGLLLFPLGATYYFAIDEPASLSVSVSPELRLEVPRFAIPSMLPFAWLLVTFVWVIASELGIVPIRYTPWRNLAQTIWLESACVDKSNAAALLQAGYSEYMAKCDCMVAFVSPGYFRRLWCVYELATFCRRYCDGPLRSYLEQDLMIMSGSWSWNPCSRGFLTEEESKAIRSFRCRDARTLRPNDRAILLAYIRRDWGSEDAFDNFVRAELPLILADSKQRQSKRMSKLVNEHIDLAFGG